MPSGGVGASPARLSRLPARMTNKNSRMLNPFLFKSVTISYKKMNRSPHRPLLNKRKPLNRSVGCFMAFFDFLKNKTIPVYQDRIAKNPDDAEAHFLLGVQYEREGETDKAISAFEEVVRLNPRSAETLFNLAQLYNLKNNGPMAIRYITQAGNLFSQKNDSENKDRARKLLREYHLRFKDSVGTASPPTGNAG